MTIPHYNVVIATPGSSFKPEYVKSLVATTTRLNQEDLTYHLVNQYSSFVPTARELTALDSTQHNFDTTQIGSGKFTCDKIFWIDSDIEWTPDDFMSLYRSGLDIVSGLYQLDWAGTVAVSVANKHGNPTRVNKVEFLLHDDAMPVGGVGFGFLAVKSSVWEDIPRPWFIIAKVKWRPEDPDSPMVNMGEDYSWCERAKAAGYKIWVDPNVKVKHHKETVYEV